MAFENIPLAERFLSESLYKKLQLIEDESPIAKALLRTAQHPLDINYMRNATLTEDGVISYLPKGKESTLSSNGRLWDGKNRQLMKVGRFIKAWAEQWSYNYYDTAIEQFHNLLVSEAKGLPEHPFKIVSGMEVRKYYHGTNYSELESLGTLAGSCMRGTTQLPFLKMYVDNPHRIQLLCLFSKQYPDKIIGRALVWQTTRGTFMDRIYADDATQKLFIRYARTAGWMYRAVQNREPGGVYLNGKEVCSTGYLMVTDLTIDAEGKFPYLDTMNLIYPVFGVVGGSKLLGEVGLSGHYQSTTGTASTLKGYASRFHHGAIIPAGEAEQGYACYQDFKANQPDKFRQAELFKDAQLNQWFHVSNLVTGVDGKFYVCDNEHLVYLDGEKYNLPARRSDAQLCFYDGKYYYRPTHSWNTFTLRDRAGNATSVVIRDLKVDLFIKENAVTLEATTSTFILPEGTTLPDYLAARNIALPHTNLVVQVSVGFEEEGGLSN